MFFFSGMTSAFIYSRDRSNTCVFRQYYCAERTLLLCTLLFGSVQFCSSWSGIGKAAEGSVYRGELFPDNWDFFAFLSLHEV